MDAQATAEEARDSRALEWGARVGFVVYGLVYGVHLGIGGPRKDMAVLMGINQNGQSISLSNHFKERGITTGAALRKDISASGREYTFAQTFPTGTHAMWLHYWLAAHGIDPLRDVRTIVVPPPQMVANVRVGNMDGFCVGEPWGARAIYDNAAFTVATSQDIWPDHPEKVLGCTADFARQQPNTARALIMAVLDAARFVDDVKNRPEVARLISGKAYVDAPEEVILGRFYGLTCGAVSVITNMAAGMSSEHISHEHTKASAPVGAAKLERILRRWLRGL